MSATLSKGFKIKEKLSLLLCNRVLQVTLVVVRASFGTEGFDKKRGALLVE